MSPLAARQEARRHQVAMTAPRGSQGHHDAVRTETESVLDVRRSGGMARCARQALDQTGVLRGQPMSVAPPVEVTPQAAGVIGQCGLRLRFDESDRLMTRNLPPRCGRAQNAENGLIGGMQQRLEVALGRSPAEGADPFERCVDGHIFRLFALEFAEGHLRSGAGHIEGLKRLIGRSRFVDAHEGTRSQIDADARSSSDCQHKHIQHVSRAGDPARDCRSPHTQQLWRSPSAKWGIPS